MLWRPARGSGGTGACDERVALSPQPLRPQHPHSNLHALRYAPSWDFPGVQWLKLHTSNAGGSGLIPGQEAKIPHATRCS